MRLDRLRRITTSMTTASLCTAPLVSISHFQHDDTGFRSPLIPFFSCLQGGGPSDAKMESVENDDDEASSSTSGGSDQGNTFEPFIASDWIGCGHVWGSGLPTVVQEACETIRVPPSHALYAIIPPSSLSVVEVLSPKWHTPQPTHPAIALPEFLMGSPPNIFTRNSFNREDAHLLRSFCHQSLSDATPHAVTLSARFNQAWLDGAQSFRIPSAPSFHYPLWMITLVSELRKSLRKQLKWNSSIKWLQGVWDSNESSEVADLTETCWDYLTRIPWDAAVPNAGPSCRMTTEHLALFLSNEWLDDEMVNAGVSFINRRLDSTRRVQIANCMLINILRLYRPRNPIYQLRMFRSLDSALRSGTVSIIDIPVNPGNHWTCIRLNLDTHTVAYMDSLNPSAAPPAEMLDLLTWYLDSILPESAPNTFSFVPLPFSMPRQRDGHSCGVALLSTLAHIHLGYSPWLYDMAVAERMRWFIRLADGLLSASGDGPDDNDVCNA